MKIFLEALSDSSGTFDFLLSVAHHSKSKDLAFAKVNRKPKNAIFLQFYTIFKIALKLVLQMRHLKVLGEVSLMIYSSIRSDKYWWSHSILYFIFQQPTEVAIKTHSRGRIL